MTADPSVVATAWSAGTGLDDAFVGALRRSVPSSTFHLWLDGVQLVDASGDTAVVAIPAVRRAWVEERFGRVIAAALRESLGRQPAIRFIDADEAVDDIEPELTVPANHKAVRVPLQHLLHYPVERDPHAATNWRGTGLRRWEHVGADVEVDHVSSVAHVRAMVAVAACIQDGLPRSGRVFVSPGDFLRACGIPRAGGRDVRDLLRVLADWTQSERLRVVLRVPRGASRSWGPAAPTTVIDRVPARAAVLTADGKVLGADTAQGAGIVPALLVLEVDPQFAAAVADPSRCRFVATATIANASSRELIPYLRYQALTPAGGADHRLRYAAWPWLMQVGLHGRTDPERENDADAVVARRARRARAKARRRMELDLRDDLLRLCDLDRGYSWVTVVDAPNGYAAFRVGVGRDRATRSRVYGPHAGAAALPRLARRLWRRQLQLSGRCSTTARSPRSTRRSLARVAVAALRSGPPALRRVLRRRTLPRSVDGDAPAAS